MKYKRPRAIVTVIHHETRVVESVKGKFRGEKEGENEEKENEKGTEKE